MTSNVTPSSSGFQVRQTRSDTPPPEPSTGAEPSYSRQRTSPRPARNETEKVAAVKELMRGGGGNRQTEQEAPPKATPGGQPTARSLLDALDDDDAPVPGSPHRGDTPEEGGDEQRQAVDLSDIKAIAKALGTTPQKLYEGLTFQFGESQMTLGQMKDAALQQQTAVQETAKREAVLASREAGIARNEQIIGAIWSDLQGKLNPETVAAVQQRMAVSEEHQRNMVRQTMPELADPQAFHSFRNDVAEMMGEYGFKPQELVITDHRILLALRDMLRFKKVLAKVAGLETERTRKEPPSTVRSRRAAPTNKQAETDRIVQRARRGTEADKVSAVARLLKG